MKISNRAVGTFVVLVSLLALGQLLFLSYHDRQQAQCQREVNARVIGIIKERSIIFEKDRESLDVLFETLVATPGDDPESEKIKKKAVDEYFQTQDELEEEIAKYQYPDVNKQC